MPSFMYQYRPRGKRKLIDELARSRRGKLQESDIEESEDA
jgi:hypothetical protein